MKKNTGKKIAKSSLKPETIRVMVFGLVFILIGAYAVYSIIAAVYTPAMFIVERSTVRSNVPLEDSIYQRIAGQPLFHLDIAAIRQTITRMHPEFKEVWVIKEYPNAVRVTARKREPFAQIKGRKFYTVDRSGVIMANTGDSADPNLISIDAGLMHRSFHQHETITNPGVSTAFALIEELRGLGIQRMFPVSCINAVSEESLYFVIAGPGNGDAQAAGVRVILGQGEHRRKLIVFSTIVREKLKNDMSTVNYIDMRYKEAYIGLK